MLAPPLHTTTTPSITMKYFRILETVYEDKVLSDTDSEASNETLTTEVISASSSRSTLEDMVEYSVRVGDIPDLIGSSELEVWEIAKRRFDKKLSGFGMIVKTLNSKGTGMVYRRLSYMGKSIYVSSLFETKEIAIDTILSSKTSGKRLVLDINKTGVMTLKMPSVLDALAFSKVLSSPSYFSNHR